MPSGSRLGALGVAAAATPASDGPQQHGFYERHLIPRNPELHKIENFGDFLEERGEMIKSRLRSILGNSEQTL